ncbi:MAG: hypothetical protein L0220_16150, partial [Acidobacteria bacterium]|nr:hypothetical protein [Acidobacteriota bacterium]
MKNTKARFALSLILTGILALLVGFPLISISKSKKAVLQEKLAQGPSDAKTNKMLNIHKLLNELHETGNTPSDLHDVLFYDRQALIELGI